ncbi:MAG: hypothetical protein WAM42_06790, partial [Candidatus Nitrosopolaris sp.]
VNDPRILLIVAQTLKEGIRNVLKRYRLHQTITCKQQAEKKESMSRYLYNCSKTANRFRRYCHVF